MRTNRKPSLTFSVCCKIIVGSVVFAVKALASLPLQAAETEDSELSSPEEPLPLYQQRYNYYS